MYIKKRLAYLKALGYTLQLIALLVLVGWQFNITLLKSFTPEMTAMNPLTALTFILSGLWFLQIKESKEISRIIAPSLAIIIFLIGTIHSLAYLLHIDRMRFDHFLFKTQLESSKINAHMAPISAVLFTLSGFNMITILTSQKWILKLRAFFSIVIFILSYTSILGYVYGRDSAYRVEGISTIALNTAILFLLFSTGLFLTNIKAGTPKLFASLLEGSSLLRRSTFLILFLPPFLGYLRLKGEHLGLYNTEMGTELYTIALTIIAFILIYTYANLLNKKQKISMTLEKN